MKRLSLSLPALAAFGVLGLAVGFGVGRIGRVGVAEGPADREAGAAGMASVLEPSAVTGTSLAEKAARTEVRAFQPGRPFPTGGAEAWLLGLRAEGFDDSDAPGMAAAFRHLSTLDDASAREVAEAIHAIAERMEADETATIWEDHEELLEAAFAAALSIVVDADPEAALALLTPVEDWNDEYTGMVWSRIARTAPERLESLLAGVEKETFTDALRGAVLGLAGSDPEAAMTLLSKNPGKDFEDVRDSLIEHVMATDPRRGVEMAAQFARDGVGNEHLRSAVEDWFDHDEETARKWVESYGGPRRDAMLAMLLVRDVDVDLRGALRDFSAMRGRGVDEMELRSAAGAIVRTLAKKDHATAWAWVDGLSQGVARENAVASLANEWISKDPPGASEWMATLSAGPGRDWAVQVLTRRIAESDPAAALAWARSVTNESARDENMRRVFGVWRRLDSAAAEAAYYELPASEQANNFYHLSGAIESDAIDSLLNEVSLPESGRVFSTVIGSGAYDGLLMEGLAGIDASNYPFVPPGGIPVGSHPADLFPEE